MYFSAEWRSADAGTVNSTADLAHLLSRLDARTVLVDGRSGSGKSALAEALRDAWQSIRSGAHEPVQVVHLDDIYPGWNGLDWASEHVRRALLAPRMTGNPGQWRQWDWQRDAPGAVHLVSADSRLIVEGVGALTARSRALADLGIWVEAPTQLRRERALTRDGDLYALHWNQWARIEDRYLKRESPRAHADLIVDTSGAFERADGIATGGTKPEH